MRERLKAGEMDQPGLADPLNVVRAITILERKFTEIGLKAETSTNMDTFAAERQNVRDGQVSPMFDPAINDFSYNNAFWIRTSNAEGETIGLQAFRSDLVGTNLADWALPWMIGLYAKRAEFVVPNFSTPPTNSRSTQIGGKLAYHGELWISRTARTRNLIELIPKLGLLLALTKWQPDAVWALVSHAMATRGHALRMGYAHFERGFLNWDWEPHGAEPVEWLILSERADIEYIANELTREI
jgi:hypothetical protein